MRTISICTIGCCLMFATGAMGQNNPPVVSNVTASQPSSCAVVNIGYDIADADADPCTVWVAISQDAGATWNVPALNLTGDVGSGITPGTGKAIVWDARLDVPGLSGSSFQVRVFADDQQGAGPIMLFVTPGSYEMGDTAHSHEGPRHAVPLSGFWISKYEVSNTEYAVFLNAGGNDDHWDSDQKITRAPDGGGGYIYSLVSGFEQHPVAYVNYDDATDYCVWLSAVRGGTYGLPTEAQWGKAAAWDPTIQKHWEYCYQSDSVVAVRANYSNSNDPWNSAAAPRATPVGFYDGTLWQKTQWDWPDPMTEYQTEDAKSFYGCRDMSGNLSEWCYDWYSSTYYQDYVDAGSPPAPTGPVTGTDRVLRGGDWSDHSSLGGFRSAYRAYDPPSDRTYLSGFRVAAGTP